MFPRLSPVITSYVIRDTSFIRSFYDRIPMRVKLFDNPESSVEISKISKISNAQNFSAT